MLIETRQPKYAWGQRVCAAIDLVNDGSYPDVPVDALLVPAGGPVVGCLEEEIALAGVRAAASAVGAAS